MWVPHSILYFLSRVIFYFSLFNDLKRSFFVRLGLKGHLSWDCSLFFLLVNTLIFSLYDDLKRSVFAKLPLKGHEAFEVDSVLSALLAQCQDPSLL